MQIGTSTLSNISPNFTTPVGTEDYMNSEKNLKKASEEKIKSGEQSSDDLSSPTNLSDDEKRLVKDLQLRDAEVRAHESAHQSGGGTTGAASFSYQQGPDGKMYAIGGQVSISFKSGSTPEETIRNAQAVIGSAMAAANPSPQDFAVASTARIIQMKAQQQLQKEQQVEMHGKEIYKNESNKNLESEKNTNALDIPA